MFFSREFGQFSDSKQKVIDNLSYLYGQKI